MSIIEQATRRLEDLASAGVVVPWAAAGLAQSAVQSRVESVAATRRPAPRLLRQCAGSRKLPSLWAWLRRVRIKLSMTTALTSP